MSFHGGKTISERLVAISHGQETLQMKSGGGPLVLYFTVLRLILMPGGDFVSGDYKGGWILGLEVMPDGQE